MLNLKPPSILTGKKTPIHLFLKQINPPDILPLCENLRTNRRVSETVWVSQWVNEQASEWVSKWTSERVSVWVKDLSSDRVNERVIDWVSEGGRRKWACEWGRRMKLKRVGRESIGTKVASQRRSNGNDASFQRAEELEESQAFALNHQTLKWIVRSWNVFQRLSCIKKKPEHMGDNQCFQTEKSTSMSEWVCDTATTISLSQMDLTTCERLHNNFAFMTQEFQLLYGVLHPLNDSNFQ